MKKCVFMLLIIPVWAFAQDEPEKYGMDSSHGLPEGLEVGQEAPLFHARSIEGEELDFAEILKKGPIVLLFYRGQWCPVCNRYLSNLNDSLRYIEEKGATVIAVGPETQENAQKTADKTNAGFKVVADTEMEIINAYNVSFYVTKAYQNKIMMGKLMTSIAKNNDQEDAQLPVPATYIIDRKGTIIYRQFDYNYRNRASVREIIAHL